MLGAVVVAMAACTDSNTPEKVTAPSPQPGVTTPAPVKGTMTTDVTAVGNYLINTAVWTADYTMGAGTGGLNPFLRVQASPNEKGFNTDTRPAFNVKNDQWTKWLSLNTVPSLTENVTVGSTIYGGPWREFILDANEANSAPDAHFSIDELDIWVCNNAAVKTLTETQFATLMATPSTYSCTSVYTLGAAASLGATDANTSGSGLHVDYRILIPTANFPTAANAACTYDMGAGDCGWYVLAYVEFGFVGGEWITGSTFEEMSTIERPVVPGTVTVKKVMVGGTGTFTYTGTPNGSISTNNGTIGPVSVAPGTYTSTEGALAGWTLGDIACNDGASLVPSTWNVGTATATFHVEEGENVTCTFTNYKDASLDVEKVSLGGVGPFDFLATGTPLINFSRTTTVEGTATTTAPVAIPYADFGTKYVQETVPAGYAITNITCSANNADVVIGSGGSSAFVAGATSGFDAGDNTIKVTVDAGDTPTCTFENSKTASLAIQKNSGLQTGSFDFLATGTGLSNFTRNTATQGNPTTQPAFPISTSQFGEKYIQETIPAGWSLTNIVCTANGAVVTIGSGGSGAFTQGATADYDAGDNTVKVAITAGDTPTCTFYNTQAGSLAIQKKTVGGTGTFTYVGTGSGVPATFSRNTATQGNPTTEAAFSIGGNQLGDKYVQEDAKAGWTLTDISCTGNGATIVIGRGGSGAFETGGSNGFDAGDNTVKVTFVNGNTPTCTFENTLDGSIDIEKTTIGGTGTFDFTGTGAPLASSFSRTTTAANTPTATAPVVVTAANFGVKYVQETVPAGWALTGISCTNDAATIVIGRGGSGSFSDGGSNGFDAGDNTVKVTVGAGQDPSCTFENTKLAELVVQKIMTGGTSEVWTFTRATMPSGVTSSFSLTHLQTSTTGPTLMPGSYNVCETNVPAGYGDPTATFQGSPATILGDGAGNYCWNGLALAAGELKTLIVTDYPPPGTTRTIGYWKNWSSCDGKGRQWEQALARDMWDKTLDGNLPQTVGELVLDGGTEPGGAADCMQAVYILGKMDINGGRHPGDAAYGLAAQYLAAVLNKTAGSGTCAAAETALAKAQRLMTASLLAGDGPGISANDGIHFTGTGTYLTSQYGDSDVRMLANSLASTLDSFNNGTLGAGCPTHAP